MTFHSLRHTVSTKLKKQEALIREIYIDTVLGHEAFRTALAEDGLTMREGDRTDKLLRLRTY
ncbi:hypothetical protein ACI01nite_26030 [Acetobacter cibinongensis]|uniref:Integrase n=1 Tax=Acetobacter cibinongensis TaxID=146475 RepID=A0A0D6N792_9PROT|nr:hypothetical protein Abci_024_002 [Acetobacter cibinongensis]GBQ14360.1 hypothetical protein AA0482_0884 [Acetobacter cibinongensis NRIC 0482]GEL60001.1 hypothetical protein ACI01nite_26030 [Acetobacter cibinongensis]